MISKRTEERLEGKYDFASDGEVAAEAVTINTKSFGQITLSYQSNTHARGERLLQIDVNIFRHDSRIRELRKALTAMGIITSSRDEVGTSNETALKIMNGTDFEAILLKLRSLDPNQPALPQTVQL